MTSAKAMILPALGAVMFVGALFSCGGGGGGGDVQPPEPIVLVSQSTAGVAGSESSESAGLSYDGRYVVFYSYAPNLIPNDTSADYDVFLRDVEEGITSRESVSTAGTQADNASYCYSPAISDNGRYLAFETESTNLFAGDDNDNTYDIVVRDTLGPLTALVSKSSGGTQGNFGSYYPAISGDGRWVAFQSDATNLVTGDTNGLQDIFLHDRQTGDTVLVSVDTTGGPSNDDSYEPAISGDGRYVAFQSRATDLVTNDTNGVIDIFVRDMQTLTTTRASVGIAGTQSNDSVEGTAISGNGRYVAFSSAADNLVADDTNGQSDIFVRDLKAMTTTRASLGVADTQSNGWSGNPSISYSGRYVAFESAADNLVANDVLGYDDIFVRDLQTNITARVSVSAAGTEANDSSYYPYISPDGRYVVFQSQADNLVSAPADLGPFGTMQIYRAPVW